MCSSSDLLAPAKNEANNVILPTKVEEKIAQLDPAIFTVSSIFCSFQASTIVDSFQLRRPDGTSVEGLANIQVVDQFSSSISTYFAALQDDQANGVPTADNPFVLGYTISQKLPDTADIDLNASDNSTPTYFQPKQWSCTVSPGEAPGSNGLLATSGTLNYCMLTFGKGEKTLTDVDPTDQNAGIFSPTFFDITKTMGRTLDSRGDVQGCDGVMAISRHIFSDQWLYSIAEAVLPDPVAMYREMLAKAMDVNQDSVEIKVKPYTSTRNQSGVKLVKEWDIEPVTKEMNFFELKPFDRQKRANGVFLPSLVLSTCNMALTD